MRDDRRPKAQLKAAVANVRNPLGVRSDRRERAMVRYLRVMVADDEGVLEVLEA